MGYDHYTLTEKLQKLDDVAVDYYGSGESWRIEIAFSADKRHRVQAAVAGAEGINCEKPNNDGDERTWIVEPKGKTRSTPQ